MGQEVSKTAKEQKEDRKTLPPNKVEGENQALGICPLSH